MAGDDPVKMKEIERLPMLEYYFQLNRKLEMAKKAKEETEKSKMKNK